MAMKIDSRTVEGMCVVGVIGDIDGQTAPVAQAEILPLVQSQCRILLDMSEVAYMSSAGLRMMLLLFRQVSAVGGRIVLSGLSEEIRDTMSLTGFLDFFTTSDTVEAGLLALRA